MEYILFQAFEKRTPEIIGNDYLVLGTFDKATWRHREKETLWMDDITTYLHDFKEYLNLEYAPAHWATVEGQQSQEEPAPRLAIDDPIQVEALLKKMGRYLPIRAEIQRRTANSLRARGVSIPLHRQIAIQKTFYHGDEGGIVCAISPTLDDEAVVISITHLKIPYNHPLEKDIRAYQQTRIKKLAEEFQEK